MSATFSAQKSFAGAQLEAGVTRYEPWRGCIFQAMCVLLALGSLRMLLYFATWHSKADQRLQHGCARTLLSCLAWQRVAF